MGAFIITRDKNQCKSHHQKMMDKYQSIPNILSNHREIMLKNIDDIPMMMKNLKLASILKPNKRKPITPKNKVSNKFDIN